MSIVGECGRLDKAQSTDDGCWSNGVRGGRPERSTKHKRFDALTSQTAADALPQQGDVASGTLRRTDGGTCETCN